MNDRSQRSSSEPTRGRLLDAVERIFAEQAPSAATMRTIAAEAGCSVGVSYRYFDSKNELFGAALDRMATRIMSEPSEGEYPADVLRDVWGKLAMAPAFPRLISWMVFEGEDVSSAMSGHPLIREVAETARVRGHEDPLTAGGVMALLILAGAAYGPTINHALGRDPDDPALYNATSDMFGAWMDPEDKETA